MKIEYVSRKYVSSKYVGIWYVGTEDLGTASWQFEIRNGKLDIGYSGRVSS